MLSSLQKLMSIEACDQSAPKRNTKPVLTERNELKSAVLRLTGSNPPQKL